MKTIEEKAYSHVDKIFSEIIDKYRTASWNEFRDALAQIYLAGATGAHAGQWKDPKKELPQEGIDVVVFNRLEDYNVDRRINGEWQMYYDENVIAWMPIPPKDENE